MIWRHLTRHRRGLAVSPVRVNIIMLERAKSGESSYVTLYMRSSRKKILIALKLDRSKGYDRVEWVFLAVTMRRLGFSAKWIALDQECLSSISYSFFINGSPMDAVVPQRGIRGVYGAYHPISFYFVRKLS
ncbi:hypothetical protein ACOSQ2_019733 [Xanthoceras sorbifolium]